MFPFEDQRRGIYNKKEYKMKGKGPTVDAGGL